MKKLSLLILAFSACISSAWAETTVTVTHAEVPTATYIDLGQASDSVGDQRIWRFGGKTLDDQDVMMDWVMITTGEPEPDTLLQSRLTSGTFVFGTDSGDRILIQGVGMYPTSGSTVKVASTLERAVIGGTGKYAGAAGTVMTTHLEDGTWQHVFSLK